jgi:hypothetical protein
MAGLLMASYGFGTALNGKTQAQFKVLKAMLVHKAQPVLSVLLAMSVQWARKVCKVIQDQPVRKALLALRLLCLVRKVHKVL